MVISLFVTGSVGKEKVVNIFIRAARFHVERLLCNFTLQVNVIVDPDMHICGDS